MGEVVQQAPVAPAPQATTASPAASQAASGKKRGPDRRKQGKACSPASALATLTSLSDSSQAETPRPFLHLVRRVGGKATGAASEALPSLAPPRGGKTPNIWTMLGTRGYRLGGARYCRLLTRGSAVGDVRQQGFTGVRVG